MAEEANLVLTLRPTSVAIHDDSNGLRDIIHVELYFIAIHNSQFIILNTQFIIITHRFKNLP